MIELKTPEELERMRHAGMIVGTLLRHLQTRVAPGVTTKALDREAETFIRDHGAEPAFLGYRGFPASICVSINEEVVHGIPGNRRIESGDIVSVDAGAIWKGFYGDGAVTIPVGSVAPTVQRLVDTTRASLERAIAAAQPANRLEEICRAVQQTVETAGFAVVRAFVGHGIGRALHEDPPVPNFGQPHPNPRLKPGMVLAIEPMVTMGSWDVEILSDGWTAVTKDRSLAAHFEHTVAITEDGPQVLTAGDRP